VHFYFPEFKTVRPLKEAARGLRVSGAALKIPLRPEEACGEPTKYIASRRFTLEAGDAKARERAGLFGIIPDRERFSAAFFVELPKTVRAGTVCTFHIEHWIENRLVGGSSYEVRAQPRTTSKKPRAARR
jgi:hypothetical protein